LDFLEGMHNKIETDIANAAHERIKRNDTGVNRRRIQFNPGIIARFSAIT